MFYRSPSRRPSQNFHSAVCPPFWRPSRNPTRARLLRHPLLRSCHPRPAPVIPALAAGMTEFWGCDDRQRLVNGNGEFCNSLCRGAPCGRLAHPRHLLENEQAPTSDALQSPDDAALKRRNDLNRARWPGKRHPGKPDAPPPTASPLDGRREAAGSTALTRSAPCDSPGHPRSDPDSNRASPPPPVSGSPPRCSRTDRSTESASPESESPGGGSSATCGTTP